MPAYYAKRLRRDTGEGSIEVEIITGGERAQPFTSTASPGAHDAAAAAGDHSEPRMRAVLDTIAAGLAALCLPAVHAAEAPAAIAAPVVVTGTRIDDSAARHAIGGRTIRADEIEASGATTLPELLRSHAGLRTRDSPFSPNPQVDLRGFGSFGDQNTLVLVDGVRMREYEQLTVNWRSIPLSAIERIEILPAASTVLYGSGATGGTINIVTKAPAPHSHSAYLQAGVASYDTRELSLDGALGASSTGLRLYGSHFETEGYRDNQYARIRNASMDLRWGTGADSLALKLGGDHQRNGVPGALSEAQLRADRRQATTPGDFASQHGAHAVLSARSAVGSADIGAELAYRTRDTDSSFLVGTPFRNNVDTRVSVWSFAPRLTFSPQPHGWDDSLVVGVDVDAWDFESVSGPAIAARALSTQRSAALYAQYGVAFATGTTASAGVREQRSRQRVVDRVRAGSRDEREHDLTAWDISMHQALGPGRSVYLKVGRSFRLPNVNDNFHPVLARITLLEPQTAHDRELGLEARAEGMQLRAVLYRADLDNEIFFDPLTLGSRNRQPTRRQGVEVEGRLRAMPELELHANYLYADATFRSGQAGAMPLAGRRVPLVPRHTIRAGLVWMPSEWVRLEADARYFSRSVFDADEANTFGRSIPAYTVVDLRLTLHHGGWLVNGGVRNLFDERYFSYAVFTGMPTFSALPAPERSLFVTAQYRFL